MPFLLFNTFQLEQLLVVWSNFVNDVCTNLQNLHFVESINHVRVGSIVRWLDDDGQGFNLSCGKVTALDVAQLLVEDAVGNVFVFFLRYRAPHGQYRSLQPSQSSAQA